MKSIRKMNKVMTAGFLMNLIALLSEGYRNEGWHEFLSGLAFGLLLVGILIMFINGEPMIKSKKKLSRTK